MELYLHSPICLYDMVFNQAQLFNNGFNQNYLKQQQWL